MSRRPFTQRDIERAIRAARNAGERGPVRVEIEGGKLVIVTSPPETAVSVEASGWRDRIEAFR